VARAARPKLNPNYSPTVGLTAGEMDRLLAAADADSAASSALVRLVFTEGLRGGSALTTRVQDLGHDQGHSTLQVRVKGRAAGEPDRIPLPPVVAAAIDAMLDERGNPADGPLFLTRSGKPIYYMYVYRLVKRLAKAAGIAAAAQLTPHGLRATAITLYLDATNGDVRGAQRFAGHARPETTIGYDRRRKTYSDHGAYVLAQRFGDRPTGDAKLAPPPARDLPPLPTPAARRRG
jgi:integrase/recombinase XerD